MWTGVGGSSKRLPASARVTASFLLPPWTREGRATACACVPSCLPSLPLTDSPPTRQHPQKNTQVWVHSARGPIHRLAAATRHLPLEFVSAASDGSSASAGWVRTPLDGCRRHEGCFPSLPSQPLITHAHAHDPQGGRRRRAGGGGAAPPLRRRRAGPQRSGRVGHLVLRVKRALQAPAVLPGRGPGKVFVVFMCVSRERKRERGRECACVRACA